jgi:hypothetical protein
LLSSISLILALLSSHGLPSSLHVFCLFPYSL